DTYLRMSLKPGEEVVSPQQVAELYNTNKLRKKLGRKPHAEFDLLVLQRRGDVTEIVKGCEVTAVRRLHEDETKEKQKNHHNNGQCIQDMLLDNDQGW